MASNYTVQHHTHNLTTILSSSETLTQTQSKNRFGIDFNSITVNYNETTYSFAFSDNLFDDMCLVQMQINNSYEEIKDILKSRASNENAGLVQLKEGGGLLNDNNNLLCVDFSSLQPKLVSGQNIKTVGGVSILKGADDDSDIDVITKENLANEIQKIEISSKLTNLEDAVNSIKGVLYDTTTTVGETTKTIPGLESIVSEWKTTIASIQSQIVDILVEINKIKTACNIS